MRRDAESLASGGRLIAAAALIVGLAVAGVAHGDELQVDPFGQDVASCGHVSGVTSPCKTLQYALNKAAAGDSIYLDLVGDYGPGVITKTISIRGAAAAGVYSPAGVPCFRINAGVNDVVSITGVTCDQGGAAKDGIQFNSGHRLRLVDVVLRRGGNSCAVRFQPNNNAEFDFSNLTASNWGIGGSCVIPRSGADATGTIDGASLQDNTYGLLSIAGTGSVNAVTCDDCRVAGGTFGIYSRGLDSSVSLKNALISNTSSGLSHPANGKLISNGGNSSFGNVSNGTFTSTVPPT